MTWALIRIFRLLTHPPVRRPPRPSPSLDLDLAGPPTVRRPPRPSPGLDLDLAGPPMVLVNEPGEHVAHATSWQCTGLPGKWGRRAEGRERDREAMSERKTVYSTSSRRDCFGGEGVPPPARPVPCWPIIPGSKRVLERQPRPQTFPSLPQTIALKKRKSGTSLVRGIAAKVAWSV